VLGLRLRVDDHQNNPEKREVLVLARSQDPSDYRYVIQNARVIVFFGDPRPEPNNKIIIIYWSIYIMQYTE
jgi:hypothetical protein